MPDDKIPIGDRVERATSEPSEPTNAPKPGDTIADKYRVERVIGEGGMGRVYAAENLLTGKKVALKVVLASARSEVALGRFAREARAAGRISHKNVVDVYDVVEDARGTCMVMELLEGEPLDVMLRRQGRLPVPTAVGIVVETARGVAAAHAGGVIHRDLKPPNIFLSAPGGSSRLKVLDFGVSKMTADDGGPKTAAGVLVGTPHYMAPEQVAGTAELDLRVDVYALGAVLYELLAGRPPYDHPSITALLVQIATEPPTPLASLREDLPEGLGEIVERAMARDREARFEDMESFARALEPFGFGVTFDPSGEAYIGHPGLPRSDSMALGDTLAAPSSPRSAGRARAGIPETAVTSVSGAAPARWGLLAAIVGVALLVVAALLYRTEETATRPGADLPTPGSEATGGAATAVEAPPAPRTPVDEGEGTPSLAAPPAPGPTAPEPVPTPPVPAQAAVKTSRPSPVRSREQTPSEPPPRAGEISVDDF